MTGACCILRLHPVAAFHRPAVRSHMRSGVVTGVAGEVVTVAAGLWRRAVGWDGVLIRGQYKDDNQLIQTNGIHVLGRVLA
jgi:hypothetical protein